VLKDEKERFIFPDDFFEFDHVLMTQLFQRLKKEKKKNSFHYSNLLDGSTFWRVEGSPQTF
jgi:hypothetical protein